VHRFCNGCLRSNQIVPKGGALCLPYHSHSKHAMSDLSTTSSTSSPRARRSTRRACKATFPELEAPQRPKKTRAKSVTAKETQRPEKRARTDPAPSGTPARTPRLGSGTPTARQLLEAHLFEMRTQQMELEEKLSEAKREIATVQVMLAYSGQIDSSLIDEMSS
jgi:hypothetical protein